MAGGTLVQNDLLPLDADVFGPFDQAGEVSLGSDGPVGHAEFSIPRERRRHDNTPIPNFLEPASNKGFFFALVVLFSPKGAARVSCQFRICL